MAANLEFEAILIDAELREQARPKGHAKKAVGTLGLDRLGTMAKSSLLAQSTGGRQHIVHMLNPWEQSVPSWFQ